MNNTQMSVATMLSMARECQEQAASYAEHTVAYLRMAHEAVTQEAHDKEAVVTVQATQVTLPDCMMPDGADPCVAYQRLRDQNESLRKESDRLLRIADSELADVERVRDALGVALNRATTALHAILADPHGCRFCDSGVLRDPAKEHDHSCGFELARAALAASPVSPAEHNDSPMPTGRNYLDAMTLDELLSDAKDVAEVLHEAILALVRRLEKT